MIITDADDRAYPNTFSQNGLTKRELFAAMALQGMMSHQLTNIKDIGYAQYAKEAVYMADYLILALNKSQENK